MTCLSQHRRLATVLFVGACFVIVAALLGVVIQQEKKSRTTNRGQDLGSSIGFDPDKPFSTDAPEDPPSSTPPMSAQSASPGSSPSGENLNCSTYETLISGGYERMCNGKDPCCEQIRSDTDLCWDIYDNIFPGELIRKACSNCCQPGKIVGDPSPPLPSSPQLLNCSDLSIFVPVKEMCKECCQDRQSNFPICDNVRNIITDQALDNTCHYCCRQTRQNALTDINSADDESIETNQPTLQPSRFPVASPTVSPSTSLPTHSPTRVPTSIPTNKPTESPVIVEVASTGAPTHIEATVIDSGDDAITFRPGNLVVSQNGLLLSQGLSSRVVAKSGDPVNYGVGGRSSVPFHPLPDGAATYVDPRSNNPGGWIYVSNSEVRLPKNQGGVGAVTFNAQGQVIDYRMVLTGTTSNCAGGRTPWNSWISCEEDRHGRIWEVDPTGRREPRMITLGSPGKGDTGWYESFAFDVRNTAQAKFFVTEDHHEGPLRRWTVDNPNWDDPWNMLHGNGTVEYLVLTPTNSQNTTGTYQWSSDQSRGRRSSAAYFRNAEGIDVHGGELFFISKHFKSMYVLNLDSNGYVRHRIEHDLFKGTPDQIVRILGDGGSRMLYFTEDTDHAPAAGVHARNGNGNFFTIVEGVDHLNETTGLSFNPDSTFMYVAWQNGTLFEIWRDDGFPFQAETLSVRYHAR